MRTLVVTPAFNEATSIRNVVGRIIREGFPCLVVDDGSSDTTSSEARIAGATVLRLPYNCGVGGALRAGFVYAVRNNFDAIVQVDADGQHSPEQIKNLISIAVETNSDLVIGSRFLDDRQTKFHVSWPRKIAMKVLAKRASRSASVSITDATSGFRLIKGQLLFELSQHLPAYYLGDTVEALVAAGKAGYSVIEVPVTMSPRQTGVSTASTSQAVRWSARAFITALIQSYPRLEEKGITDSLNGHV